MSKLEELLNELCPNGVVQKKLKNIAFLKRGMPLTKLNAVSGDIPVISGGKEPAFYCNTFNRNGENITVAGSGAGAGYVQYWNIPIFASDCFTVTGLEVIETKFLYYFMSNIQDKIYSTKKGGGVPHVHISDVENFDVPVPPIKIQREIIRILDNFTKLTAELTAELTARKKQYAYYRNLLLNISPMNVCEYKLSQIAKFSYGYTAKAEDKGDARFIRITDITSDGHLQENDRRYILLNDENKKYMLKNGD
ncbi:MAG: restriction endonuclease subunit S, partial [Lachnoanaerobaculum sp.]|nr:restriction endonuclease subunit S [Lachnoanaerobaculum sp.]